VIRRFAREFAAARAALVLSGYGSCKAYHADLMQRAQVLLASLTGNIGRAGGGWHSGGYVDLEGVGLVSMQDRLGLLPLAWLGTRALLDPKAVERQALSSYISSTIFHTVHGGLAEVRLDPRHGDPALPRPPAAYFEEALAKGAFPLSPPPGAPPPEILISVCGNVLRHSRMAERIRDSLFKSAR
jgi:anaerobic selenocysteine-containing dehydrogenase